MRKLGAAGLPLGGRFDRAESRLRKVEGNLVALCPHELKSPLNVIAMYSEMLQSAGPGEEHLRLEAVNVIHDEVERMNALVNNLLSVSKLEMGSMRPERHRVKASRCYR